jgi:Leucine-rich repeat (LRR) protein
MGNNLSGPLPNINLDKLEFLYLTGNNINGSIPNFEFLPNLGILILNSNNLTGAIPNFQFLPNLKTLDLAGNNLTGPIPNFEFLPILEGINCVNSGLTGPIPNFEFLPNLKSLTLPKNNLNGNIPNFEFLISLERLQLADNNLIGPIPNFEFLSSLTQLFLNGNNLSGCYPDFICNLNRFDTSENPFLPNQGDHIPFCNGDDQIDAPCDDDNPLTTNDVIQNDCSCRGDSQDCTHPDYNALMELYTSTTGENWTINDGWKEGAEGTSCDPCNWNGGTWFGIKCESDRVVCIDLSGNTDCNIASGLTGNNLDGELVELDLDSLEVLNLSSNFLAGVIPDLRNLRKLRGINLVENSLTGPVPSFDNNTLIVSINLANNALDGVIPPFNSTPQLEEYDVGVNNIIGNIPVLDNVPNIRIFKCGENQLFGTIPPLQDLKNLTIFNCINNQLTGRIPNIVDLPNLISLNFGQNDFTGDFPSMEDLPSLVLFICTENNITGSIPDLSNFPSLASFMCNGNNLNGCYPDAVCNIGQFISLGNPLLPWQGNHIPFCNGEDQIGAPCDDGDDSTVNDVIVDDCSCIGTTTVDIHELSGAQIIIYPNPVSEYLNIVIQGSIEYRVTIFDINGKKLLSRINIDKVDVSTIQQGTYFIELEDLKENKKIVERIIILKK